MGSASWSASGRYAKKWRPECESEGMCWTKPVTAAEKAQGTDVEADGTHDRCPARDWDVVLLLLLLKLDDGKQGVSQEHWQLHVIIYKACHTHELRKKSVQSKSDFAL